MKYKTEVEVRYQETDAMGVVHHSVYPIWFELARIRGLREEGFAYDVMESKGMQIPVIGIEVNYLKPLKFGDFIDILFDLERESASRFRFVYEIQREGVKIATGITRHVFMNPNGRPMRPPQEFVDHFFQKKV